MLNDPRLKQAFQQYEKKQEERYSEKIWKQKHLSREAEERILNALRKQSRRLMWKKILIRAGEGLAVAAVFCLMAYAVYIAAQGPKDPIVAGTGETETEEIAETAKTEETYDKIDKILKENIDYEIMHASKEQIYPIVKDVIKNTLRRKTLAEMMFGIGMDYFYLYHDVEKAELIIESLFSVINQEEYSVPELEGTDVKEAFSWRYRDRKTGTERVIGYREFMIDTMNQYFRRAASEVLVPETGIGGYRIFVEKVRDM